MGDLFQTQLCIISALRLNSRLSNLIVKDTRLIIPPHHCKIRAPVFVDVNGQPCQQNNESASSSPLLIILIYELVQLVLCTRRFNLRAPLPLPTRA